MKEFFYNNKRTIIFIGVFVIVGLGVLFYVNFIKEKLLPSGKRIVVVENPTARPIDSAGANDARFISATGQAVNLIGRDQIVIENGYTLKDSYEMVKEQAILWAEDAKLVYIKALGTVTLSGVSSGWEILFGSKIKKKGYAITISGTTIIDKKEIISSSTGYTLPSLWYDAGEAIQSIQTLPQFKDATISGISFYYNEDGKRWGYAILSSNGIVSVPVK